MSETLLALASTALGDAYESGCTDHSEGVLSDEIEADRATAKASRAALLAALQDRRCATCRYARPHPNATAWRLCERIGGGAQIVGPVHVGVRESFACNEWAAPDAEMADEAQMKGGK